MPGGKDLSRFIVWARMAGASVTNTAKLMSVLPRAVSKVTSAFRSMIKPSINKVENCGQKRTSGSNDAGTSLR